MDKFLKIYNLARLDYKEIENLHQIKRLLHGSRKHQQMKREPTIWENIFANDTSDKGLISQIYKEPTQLHTRRQTIQLKNGKRT